MFSNCCRIPEKLGSKLVTFLACSKLLQLDIQFSFAYLLWAEDDSNFGADKLMIDGNFKGKKVTFRLISIEDEKNLRMSCKTVHMETADSSDQNWQQNPATKPVNSWSVRQTFDLTFFPVVCCKNVCWIWTSKSCIARQTDGRYFDTVTGPSNVQLEDLNFRSLKWSDKI